MESRKTPSNQDVNQRSDNGNANVLEMQNAVGGLAIKSTSTGGDKSEFSESLKRIVDSNLLQPGSIDLTTNEAEANGVLAHGQNYSAAPNMQLQPAQTRQKPTKMMLT